MSRWFVGSSRRSRFDGRIPSSASSSRDRSPPDSDADLLEHVVAAEQEAGEIAACLAGRDRDRLEQRVEDGRARDRRAAELGEVAELDVVAEGRATPSSGGRSPAIVRRSVVLPAPFGPTIPIRSPRWAARNAERATVTGPAVLGAVRRERAAARQVADREVLDPDDELARADGPPPASAAAGRPERAARPAGPPTLLAWSRSSRASCSCILRELALAPVALDELASRAAIASSCDSASCAARASRSIALAVVGAVVAAERREAAVAQLPDAGDRRVEERPVVGGDEQRAGPPAEVLLEPLDRADVEVVRRLVEQQQVRVGDHEACEGRPRLLAAGERRRRPGPLVAGEAQAGQRLVDALVERVAAEDVEAVLEVRVVGARRRGRRAPARRARPPSARGGPPRGGRPCAGPARP